MTTYKIVPGVSNTGMPIWVLWRTTIFLPFGFTTVKEAANPDRAVLERAIEHLTASPTKPI